MSLFMSYSQDDGEIAVDFTPDRDYVFVKFDNKNEIILTRVEAERLAFQLETLFMAEEYEFNAES